jgi:hypothetical protein
MLRNLLQLLRALRLLVFADHRVLRGVRIVLQQLRNL